MEHWEEGIPDLGQYEVPRLPVYETDTPHKLDGLAADLARADYILFYSNRLYGTITRLPERYPVTSAYYRLLFGGELGYQLANVETAYPNLAGVTLVDGHLRKAGASKAERTGTAAGTEYQPRVCRRELLGRTTIPRA